MSNPKTCHHNFVYIKSDNSYLTFQCSCCMMGEMFVVYECQMCQLKICGPCLESV